LIEKGEGKGLGT